MLIQCMLKVQREKLGETIRNFAKFYCNAAELRVFNKKFRLPPEVKKTSSVDTVLLNLFFT
jgi:hypothetical protein